MWSFAGLKEGSANDLSWDFSGYAELFAARPAISLVGRK